MKVFDVFNGDADGICALVQLRLANPVDSVLITGVKRDINLLSQVEASKDDVVNTLDVSMEKNNVDLERILEAGAEVFYCDHHKSGEIPDHPKLDAMINVAPDVCTAVLINQRLDGAFAKWAVVGAYGDNLKKTASTIAGKIGLTNEQAEMLEKLGIYINYNGYGSSLEDLHFAPADLYKACVEFADPLDFIASSDTFTRLQAGYTEDMASAESAEVLRETENSQAVLLPDERWARRVSGVYGNELANRNPDRAHAVLTVKKDGTYLISVRAPLNNKVDADVLCSEFPTGGGRKAAAGVNALPADMLDNFLDRLDEIYS